MVEKSGGNTNMVKKSKRFPGNITRKHNITEV
jgi:hypothetical protein